MSEIDKKTGLVRPVQSGGKPSKTFFEVRKVDSATGVAWIVCHPETGRSHQIRVHLEMMGLPIIGDKRYGQHIRERVRDDVGVLASQHHMLHARSLQFSPAPTIADVTVQANPPESFSSILKAIDSGLEDSQI